MLNLIAIAQSNPLVAAIALVALVLGIGLLLAALWANSGRATKNNGGLKFEGTYETFLKNK